jgi:hypothetical protein
MQSSKVIKRKVNSALPHDRNTQKAGPWTSLNGMNGLAIRIALLTIKAVATIIPAAKPAATEGVPELPESFCTPNGILNGWTDFI